MDATFTEEQELLADVARRIAERAPGQPTEGPGTPGTTDGADEGWRLAADAGLLALRLPADVGGSAAGTTEVALVAEAFGRSVTPTPFVGPVLAIELLMAADAPGDLLEAVGSGQRRVTVLLGPDLGTLADLAPGSGAASVAWDALGAAEVVGLGSTGGAKATLAPLQGEPLLAADLTRRLVDQPAPGTGGDRAPGPTPVGRPLAPEAQARWEAVAQVLLCADMVGAMAGGLALAVGYAKQRRQFGQPIGSFQAIQHLLADQHVSTAACRSATFYAAWAVDALSASEALDAARLAKAYVSRRAREVTEAVLQVHGGIGHTWEHVAHLHLRRVLLDRATLGDESVHEGRIADALVGAGREDTRSLP